MKKISVLFLAFAMMLSCVSCGQTAQQETVHLEPKTAQMKAICELAVMKCYYHNVAKYFEEDAIKGFLGIGKKDKHFWIEYSGVVKLGIDVSLVNIEVTDTKITITLPEAKVLSCEVDSASLTKDSFIVDKKSAAIEAADEVKAFAEAQTRLQETASADKALLASAQQRAQELLEEYITNIGTAVGKEYVIQWIYVDANGSPLGSTLSETTPPAQSEEPAA